MSTKHAPGPWKIGDEYGPVMDEIVAATGGTVCVVWTHRSRSALRAATHRREADPAPDLLANVQLITAAPDLLEALEDLRCAAINVDQDDEESVNLCEAAIRKASAAIAKARGNG